MYALGCNVGRQLGDLACFEPSEVETIFLGLRDLILRTEPKVDLATYMPKALELFKERQAAETEAARVAGLAALEGAAKEDGATVTDTGLVVRELAAGEGPTPTLESTVRVHYEGKLVDGTVFDSSLKRGEPVEFRLDRVVPGWQEGLQMMKVGGKAKLTIPAELGYGDAGQGIIPPKSALVFEVELLAVTGADAAEADGEDEEEADD